MTIDSGTAHHRKGRVWPTKPTIEGCTREENAFGCTDREKSLHQSKDLWEMDHTMTAIYRNISPGTLPKQQVVVVVFCCFFTFLQCATTWQNVKKSCTLYM